MGNSNPILKPGQIAVVDPTEVDSAGSGVAVDAEQKALRRLISRRHPQYADNLPHWQFLRMTYDGGREWFKTNVFRYIKEGEKEFGDRLGRAYRFNHTREVVDLLNKYLFKQNIQRNHADAPECVSKFWQHSTRQGLTIKDFARQVSKATSTVGRVGIVIDNMRKGDDKDEIISKADEQAAGIRTYAYIVPPEQLLDYAFDDEGELNWILIEEIVRDDEDPLESTGEQKIRYRLWTKREWVLLEEVGKEKRKRVVIVGRGEHGLDEVPVILADNIISDEIYATPALIDDIAYLDRAVANYLSNLDAIIQDQTFSQLAMPAQNVLPGSDTYGALVDMGTKRTFLYDGENGGKPFYLSPDVKQASLLLEVINKIINEIYHTVGLAGERTKQDNSLGIDNSSGVAKAYDFERVNALLAAKADALELIERKMVCLVCKWNGVELEDEQKSLVSYPDNFDTRGLYDEFDIAARLMLIDAPDSVRREQMICMIEKLFPQLAKDLRDKIEKELKDWPIDPMLLAAQQGGQPGAAGANPAAAKQPDVKALESTENRGQAKAVAAGK